MSLKIKNYLTVGLIYLVGFGLIGFIIVPTIKTLITEKEKIDRGAIILSALTDKAAFLGSIDETKKRSELNTLNISLPSDKNIPGLLSGLERLANSASASVDTFSIVPGKISTESAKEKSEKPVTTETVVVVSNAGDEKVLAANVHTISFQLSLLGNYQQLRNFLDGAHKANRLVGLESLNYKNAKTNLVFHVYYQPLATSLGETSDPIEDLSQKELAAIATVKSYTTVTSALSLVPAGKTGLFSE